MTIDMVDRGKGMRVIKANKALRAKIGAGPLEEQLILRCQKVMEAKSQSFDFTNMARGFLNELKDAIAQVESGKLKRLRAMQALITPVMQIKANGAAFGYRLAGNLSNVMLSFLESINEPDERLIGIMKGYYATLDTLISEKKSGDGGKDGAQMEADLKAMCKQYFSSKK